MQFNALIIVGVLAIGCAPALAQAGGQVTFSMPSGNISCIYTARGGSSVYVSADGSAEISCDRSEPRYVRVTMTERSQVMIETNVGDPSCCSLDNPLWYGESRRMGPFTCFSSPAGLTCRRDDGRGFSIAKAGVKRF